MSQSDETTHLIQRIAARDKARGAALGLLGTGVLYVVQGMFGELRADEAMPYPGFGSIVATVGFLYVCMGILCLTLPRLLLVGGCALFVAAEGIWIASSVGIESGAGNLVLHAVVFAFLVRALLAMNAAQAAARPSTDR